MINQARIASLGENLIQIREQIKDLEFQAQQIKDEIGIELEAVNIDELVIPLGEEEIVVKNNKRVTKSFDKDGLAGDIEVDRDLLDYYGISKLVDAGKVAPEKVREFQIEKTSTFVTVHTRQAVKKKGDKYDR